MKRLLAILFCLLPALSVHAQEYNELEDMDKYGVLDSLLTEFYHNLERAPLEDKNAELDGLIASCGDSLARQHVTMQIMDHYMHARIMGEEAVAIHIYDSWIGNGKVKARSEFEQFDLDLFANFNRNSLLGMKATPVTLEKPSGGRMEIPVPGRISVMFFYSSSCSKCRLETMALPSVMSEVQFPMDFYAICVDTDRRMWNSFRKTIRFKNPKIRTYHLWDPEIDSGYEKLYGVTGTPKIFVIWEDGEIMGRRLELTNLEEIIRYINMTYGKEEAE